MDILQLTIDGIHEALESLITCTQAAVQNGGGFGWLEVPDLYELQSYWRGVVGNSRIIALIASEAQIVTGSIQLVLPDHRSEAASFVGNLSVFFVHPEFRRQGIGIALLKAAEKKARSCDLTQLNLDVRATQKEAVLLYERLGFQTWGTNPRYARVKEVYIAGHYMSKYLD